MKKWLGILFVTLIIGASSTVYAISEIDTDQDGLTDTYEHELGTDALNSDSDGDGYLDGTEVENGYSPLNVLPLKVQFLDRVGNDTDISSFLDSDGDGLGTF